MKRIFIYLLPTLLLIIGFQVPAQIVIDLSTGVNNAGTLLPMNSAVPYNSVDDTWTVHTPTDAVNAYQSAACSDGQLASGPTPYTGLNPTVRWIGPYINAAGKVLGGGLPGLYDFKMTFQLNTCLPQSACIPQATIHLTTIGGDDQIQQVIMNGNAHSVSYGYLPVASNQQIVVMGNELNFGTNTIIVRLWCDGAFPGLEIKGDITIDTTTLPYALKNKDGVESSSFCLGDDVFLDASSLNTTSYFIELGKVTGASVSWISAQGPIGWATGSANWINLRTLFENDYEAPVTFGPGTYRIKFATYTSCGLTTVTKDFEYLCCTSSTDPSFELLTKNGLLYGQSLSPGGHLWKVYSASDLISGPYVQVGNFTTPDFSIETGSPCYYVLHTLSTPCGTTCMAQRFCDMSCEEATCILAPPTGLGVDSRGPRLYWNNVPGSATYFVEITINDPNCCGLIPTGSTVVKYVTVPTNSYAINLSQLGLTSYSQIQCFSWRVYAVCPNGARSIASSSYCYDEPFIGGRFTGLEEKSRARAVMNLFPNPVQGQLIITLQTVTDTEFSINVLDQTGRLVKQFELQKTTDKAATLQWNTNGLAKGIYLVVIKTQDNRVITQKLAVD